MIVKRLQKLSKDKLIAIILGRDSKIEILEEKLKEQQDVGEIFFKDKIYKVILKEVEIRNDKINLHVSKMENTQQIT